MRQAVSEEDALCKWCRYRDGNCIASDCMDWSWKVGSDRIFEDNYEPRGYCGAEK